MATIKSYTDIEQSKKLAEFLPTESADMHYALSEDGNMNMINLGKPQGFFDKTQVAWSLTALLGVLPLVDFETPQIIGTPKTLYRCIYNDDLKSHAYDNPIDACVELVLKLKELNLL